MNILIKINGQIKNKIQETIDLIQRDLNQSNALAGKVVFLALVFIILPFQRVQAKEPNVTIALDKTKPLPLAIITPQDNKINLVSGESNLARTEREAKESTAKAKNKAQKRQVSIASRATGPIDLGDLESLYRQASAEYGIPAEIIRAVASVESGEGHNMRTSSAGAAGFGQFMPGTWRAYGNGGDPYNPADAIPAIARLLAANGGSENIERALLAYNHAGWYVTKVLNLARQFGYGG